MGWMTIVDRCLEIDITDPKLKEALAPLNTNGDYQIDINDFEMANPKAVVPESVRRQAMHHAITDAFLKSGAINKNQAKGMLRFFDLYNDVRAAKWIVQKWSKNAVDTKFNTLTFNAEFWKSDVLPHVTGEGVLTMLGRHFTPAGSHYQGLTPSVGLGLSAEIYYVVHHLEDEPVDRVPWRFDETVWNYEPWVIPPVIDKQFSNMMSAWIDIFVTLRDYRSIKCEGDGCPEADSFRCSFVSMVPL